MSNIRVLDTKEAKMVLAMAEAGEIVDLAWAAANMDGSSQTGFTSTEDAPRRLATVSLLLHRLHLSWGEA